MAASLFLKPVERLRLRSGNGCCCLFRLLSSEVSGKHYDLVVIGGGSGGLACSKEAASFGKRVAVLDFVDPSPRGTKWGLGGTCVNVGCIPKKLMHQAALLGHAVKDAKSYGWSVPEKNAHSWETLSEAVANHVKSLNWGHRVQLRDKKVNYLNAKGFLTDKNTIIATMASGKQEILKADNIVIATGMRPKYPTEIAGALEYAISSDDIFWMKKPPGKTLCVGASYVSLEIAGFLVGLGYDTTVAIRSKPLRVFDQDMASLVVKAMEHDGAKILNGFIPNRIDKDPHSGLLRVSLFGNSGETAVEEFETVLMAIGRTPCTSDLGLTALGVTMDESGFIVGDNGNDHERSSVPNIYAIGDVLKDRPELTPVAIKAGKLLARRLYGLATEQMDYHLVPTTVFTPIEYSFVGMSEEQAAKQFGAEGIEVYHAFYKPLEFTVPHRQADCCYMKVITDRSAAGTILGIHYTGPNAGEIMQGYAVALRCGMTFDRLTSTIGIHPTVSEEFVKLHITKRSTADPTVTGC
jgi:thioredoxin reductase (NADPH)